MNAMRLPAVVGFVSFMLLGGGCKPRPMAGGDAGADHGRNCSQAVVELGTYKGKDLAYDDAMAEFRRLRSRADAGIAECKAAGDTEAATALEGVKQQIDQQEAALEEANRASRIAQSGDSKKQPLDPASCPKGKVMIDTATGKSVHCTGSATPAATAPSDGEDVRATCTTLKEKWRQSDGIDPIIECGSDAAAHADVKVVVTTAGWDYLRERGKRRMFAQSIVDAFKPHWKTFHGWTGSDAAGHQAHLWRMNGVDLTLAATTSASGFYLE